MSVAQAARVGQMDREERGFEAPMDIDRPVPKWGHAPRAFKFNSSGSALNSQPPRPNMFQALTTSPRSANRSSKSTATDAEKRNLNVWKILRDPQMPHLLIGYVQLFFNMSLACLILYIIGGFVVTVRRDIISKSNLHRSKLANEIAICSKAYADNRCDPANRVPALEAKCREWETCMLRDPIDIGGSRVLAETVADIVNGLVEPIALKSLIFLAVAIFGSVFLSNYAFAVAKSRYATNHPPTVHITTTSVPGAPSHSDSKLITSGAGSQ